MAGRTVRGKWSCAVGRNSLVENAPPPAPGKKKRRLKWLLKLVLKRAGSGGLIWFFATKLDRPSPAERELVENRGDCPKAQTLKPSRTRRRQRGDSWARAMGRRLHRRLHLSRPLRPRTTPSRRRWK